MAKKSAVTIIIMIQIVSLNLKNFAQNRSILFQHKLAFLFSERKINPNLVENLTKYLFKKKFSIRVLI